MSLKDIKDALWTSDDRTPPPVPQPPVSAPLVTAPRPAQPVSTAANPAYDALLAKTNFDTTDVGVIYHKYYDRLSRITDEKQRVSTALDLAMADGVDISKITAAFDQLEKRLQSETDAFNNLCDVRMKETYFDPKQQADDLAGKIAELENQEKEIRAQLQPAVDRINFAKDRFQQAWVRRRDELKSQRDAFTGAH